MMLIQLIDLHFNNALNNSGMHPYKCIIITIHCRLGKYDNLYLAVIYLALL